MALVTTIYCQQCHTDKTVTTGGGYPLPTICHECKRKNHEQKEKMYFASLKGLSLEERIEKLEQQMWEQQNRVEWKGY